MLLGQTDQSGISLTVERVGGGEVGVGVSLLTSLENYREKLGQLRTHTHTCKHK